MPDRILLVDDEIEIADLIEIYLKNENYTVFKFYTAKEALDCINTTTLDLAILDIEWPCIMPANKGASSLSYYHVDGEERGNRQDHRPYSRCR